jgi:hypothetical protein
MNCFGSISKRARLHECGARSPRERFGHRPASVVRLSVSTNDDTDKVRFADPRLFWLHIEFCGAGAPGFGTHDRRHVCTIASGIGQTVFTGIYVWMSRVIELLSHMVRFCTPFSEIVFCHCTAPHSGFQIKVLHRSAGRINLHVQAVLGIVGRAGFEPTTSALASFIQR